MPNPLSDMSLEENDFLNTLLAFLQESGQYSVNSNSSDNLLELDPRSQVMGVSGVLDSFSTKSSNNMGLIYRKCNFSTILNISWTSSSSGCITSSRVSTDTNTNVLLTALSLFRMNQEKERNMKLLQLIRSSLIEKENLKTKSEPQMVSAKNCESPTNLVQDDQKQKRVRMCNFCFKNGESVEIYLSHYLKGYNGKITCPVLRRYTCEYCGATGVRAHTRKYCPLNFLAEKNARINDMVL